MVLRIFRVINAINHNMRAKWRYYEENPRN